LHNLPSSSSSFNIKKSNFKVKHEKIPFASQRRSDSVAAAAKAMGESCETIFQLIFKSNKLKKFPISKESQSPLFGDERLPAAYSELILQ